MWMELQQTVTMATAVNNICMATKVHSSGNSVTANLLNTIKPTEHTIQQPTPVKISDLSFCSFCKEAIPTNIRRRGVEFVTGP